MQGTCGGSFCENRPAAAAPGTLICKRKEVCLLLQIIEPFSILFKDTYQSACTWADNLVVVVLDSRAFLCPGQVANHEHDVCGRTSATDKGTTLKQWDAPPFHSCRSRQCRPRRAGQEAELPFPSWSEEGQKLLHGQQKELVKITIDAARLYLSHHSAKPQCLVKDEGHLSGSKVLPIEQSLPVRN